MVRLIDIRQRLASASNQKTITRLIIVASLAVIGSVLVISSRAATPRFATEAESSTASCASSTADSSASNGAALTFKNCGGPTGGLGPLPYDMASNAALKASNKKVFAHYFTPYPISIDNKDASNDYYTNGYLSPNGESGIHAAYGGFLRERPQGRAISASPDWRLDDMKTEVSRASAAGLDGFTLDILSLSGYNWDRSNLLIEAAAKTDPSFKIMLMPDGTAGATSDVNALITSMANLAQGANNGSLYRLGDGRLVISPFAPEAKGLAYWQTFLQGMRDRGINVAFVPCFLNYNANAASWASISYGSSNWGDRSPGSNQNEAADINDAHARGKIWMQPVSLQDTRPKGGSFYEANNSENLRTTWLAAIGGADWVQIPTWNDYSETSEIAPSTSIGWGPLDINGYYLQRFKSGSYPQIKRDVLYLSHRAQRIDAPITGPQTLKMTIRNGSPARDMVEVLSFLTAPARVTVKIGTTQQSYDAPAGVFSKTYPLGNGTISASIDYTNGAKRTVTSPYTVTASREIQDFTYRFVTSGREGRDTPAP